MFWKVVLAVFRCLETNLYHAVVATLAVSGTGRIAIDIHSDSSKPLFCWSYKFCTCAAWWQENWWHFAYDWRVYKKPAVEAPRVLSRKDFDQTGICLCTTLDLLSSECFLLKKLVWQFVLALDKVACLRNFQRGPSFCRASDAIPFFIPLSIRLFFIQHIQQPRRSRWIFFALRISAPCGFTIRCATRVSRICRWTSLMKLTKRYGCRMSRSIPSVPARQWSRHGKICSSCQSFFPNA